MSNIIPFAAPSSKKELFARLQEIIQKGWLEMPDIARYRSTNTGAPGNFLEDLIGLKAGNKDIPDITGWEVKYYTASTTLITLFHKDPKPETVLRSMVKRFGIMDELGRMSLRHTIKGKSAKFKIVEDAGNVIIRPLHGNGVVPTWSSDVILNAAAHKLRRLMLVRGERKGQKVRFHRVDCFENLHISLFIPEIINGTIAIEFNAREMKPGSDGLRNHGTKFRIAPDHVCRLYFHKERMA
jgi:hypothetical protein